jgi:DNA-binding response OmpR family regulator
MQISGTDRRRRANSVGPMTFSNERLTDHWCGRRMTMTILVADDDKVHVHLLTNLLRKRGFSVSVAYDGLQAWSTALRGQPDAIILDIHMPAGTGFEVLRKLKTSTKTSQIPVIVLSGSVNADEVVTIETLGADRFLRKPADIDQLFEAVGRLLNVTPATNEGA